MPSRLEDVALEMERQQVLWGEQNHDNGTSPDTYAGALHQARLDADDIPNLTWAKILAEEFYEAMSEQDPKQLQEELIQVAAVAVSWAEAIDRRLGRGT